METEILREVPELKSVLTHIESEPGTIERPLPVRDQGQVESEAERIGRSLRTAAKQFPEILDVHEDSRRPDWRALQLSATALRIAPSTLPPSASAPPDVRGWYQTEARDRTRSVRCSRKNLGLCSSIRCVQSSLLPRALRALIQDF